ncbi:MAG: histidine phosphatase family protein [Spirochaetaceae bacterium]|jgi:probable phosphoglycerate mutase|nr:histidine phosphatase family protein [Spirochaetaceae bacterium]
MKRIGCIIAAALLTLCTAGVFARPMPEQADGGGEKLVTIYVTRHGQTIANSKGIVQGWADSPLTPEGVAVAEDLGRGLRDVPFDYVISSDLGRTRQTARLVMAQNRVSQDYPLETTEDLREACFGSFEEETGDVVFGAILTERGIDLETWTQDPNMFLIMADTIKQLDTLGIAEDAATIKARMQRKLTEVAQEQAKKGGNILLVTHGEAINIMLSDLDPAFKHTATAPENAAVSKVVYNEGTFTIESFNDRSYLEAGKALR